MRIEKAVVKDNVLYLLFNGGIAVQCTLENFEVTTGAYFLDGSLLFRAHQIWTMPAYPADEKQEDQKQIGKEPLMIENK